VNLSAPNSTGDTAPILIIGFGVAGATLAWRLLEQGVAFQVIDAADPGAASRVAPGIVNPLAGRRLKPSWQVARQLPEAMRMYDAIAAATGARCFHPMPIIRVIKDAEQAAFFEKRRKDPLAASYIGEESGPRALGSAIRDPLGSFTARGSGFLNTAAMIDALRALLAARGMLTHGCVNPQDIEPLARTSTAAQVRYAGTDYRAAVFCEGYRAAANPWFTAIPFKAAKGEMLELEGDTAALPHAILNRGKWVLPAAPGRLRAGATYSWDPLDSVPTERARGEILRLLREFIDLEFKVVGQSAGVRPIVADYRPALGRHPQFPGIACFNGLGSKGVLAGPWLAGLLADHLMSGTTLPREVDVQRFFL